MPYDPYNPPRARNSKGLPFYAPQMPTQQPAAPSALAPQTPAPVAAPRQPVSPYVPGPQPPTGNQSFGGNYGGHIPGTVTPAMESMIARGISDARLGNGRESMLYDISHPLNGRYAPRQPSTASVNQVFAPVDKSEFAKRQGLEFNPATGVLAGNSQAAGMNARQLGNLRAGVNPFAPGANKSQLAENLKNTQDARAMAAKARAGQPTAKQQRLAMQQKETENRLALMAPEQYQTRKGLEAQTAGINDRTKYAADSKLAGELAAAGFDQEKIDKFMASRGGGATAPTKSPLEAPKAGDLAKLDPGELDIALQSFPPETRERLKREVGAARNNPGFFGSLLGAMGSWVPKEFGGTLPHTSGYAPGAKEEIAAAKKKLPKQAPLSPSEQYLQNRLRN